MNFCHEQKEHHDFGSQKRLFWDLGHTSSLSISLHVPLTLHSNPLQSCEQGASQMLALA